METPITEAKVCLPANVRWLWWFRIVSHRTIQLQVVCAALFRGNDEGKATFAKRGPRAELGTSHRRTTCHEIMTILGLAARTVTL